ALPPSRTRGDPADARPDPLLARGHFRKTREQRAQIEECSAGEDRPPPAGSDSLAHRSRKQRILRGVEFVRRLEDIKQMMRHTRPLHGTRVCAAEIEPAIELDRI